MEYPCTPGINAVLQYPPCDRLRAGQVFDGTGGVAEGEGVWGDVLGDDAAGADDGTFADGDTGEDDDVAAYPHVVANFYWKRPHDASVAWLDLKRVGYGAQTYVWSDKDAVADSHLGLIKVNKVEIAHEVVADADVEPEVAVERRIDVEVLARCAKKLANYRVSLVLSRRGQRVEPETHLLAPGKLPAELLGKTVYPCSCSQKLEIVLAFSKIVHTISLFVYTAKLRKIVQFCLPLRSLI